MNKLALFQKTVIGDVSVLNYTCIKKKTKQTQRSSHWAQWVKDLVLLLLWL